MAVNKRLLQGAAAAGGFVPSEHFGVVLYEGDGSTSHSINGGKFGAGGYFTNSSSSRIELSSAVLPADVFSVSLWINVSSLTDNKWILTQYTGGTGGRFVFNYNADGGLQINVTSSNSLTSITATPLTENTWHHIVLIKNGSSGWEIYVDGSSIGTWSDTNNILTSQNTVFGGNQNVTSQSIDGKLDQVRVFTKALTSSQVSTLYAETTPESLDPLNVDTTDTLQVLGDTSCIATYRFENDEDDLSGNYDGTGTAIQYAAGRYGQAASFNGSSSKITTSAKPLNNNTSISISFWAKNISVGDWSIIIGEGGNSTQAGYRVNVKNTNDGNMSLSRSAGNGTYVISDSYMYDFGADGSDWVHCVFTVSSSEMKYYKNGQNVLTQSVSNTSTVTSAYNLNIMFDEQYSKYVGGQLDQVRIFNKTLSASEVTTLYNENPLVASYRFEGNANDDMRTYDGTATNVTYEYGLNFTPDFVWIKGRTSADNNFIFDTTRGDSVTVNTNLTAAEYADTGVTSFDTGGFTLGSGAGENRDGDDYVAWCLKANGGTTSSNTDGNVTTTVQVNSDAGFSIAKSASTAFMTSQTFGLGLAEEPDIVIVKSTDIVTEWRVYSKHLNNWDGFLKLNATDALYTSSITTTVTSTTFSSNWTNTSGIWMLYSFKSIEGFSKFGTYTGNGSANGPIVETGFEPAFIMVKRTDTADSWVIHDNKRDLVNPRKKYLLANASNAEAADLDGIDFLSNGFQLKDDYAYYNASGGTYLYMAFAADPDTEAPTVAKSFSTVAYTGTGSSQSITGLGFQPNFVWLKSRSFSDNHYLQDSVRGATRRIHSNLTVAEQSPDATRFTSLDSDGFTLGGDASVNGNGEDFVAWSWKADDNEPTINTEGSIDSIVSANANAGFSIVKLTGTGSAATIGHGLSAVPEMIIVKNLSSSSAWAVFHTSLGATKYLALNETTAEATASNVWNDTAPTATVFSVGNWGPVNTSGNEHIAYCFHSVSGYSKIGSYTGNGSATGPTVTLGFRPDWIMIKEVDNSDQWWIFDSVRGGANPISKALIANSNTAEDNDTTNYKIDFNDNDFQLKSSYHGMNNNGSTYIYMAFKIN